MPRLNVINQQQTPDSVPGAARIAAPNMLALNPTGIGQGLMDLASGIQTVEERERKEAEKVQLEQDKTWTGTAMSDSAVTWTSTLKDRMDGVQPGAPDFTKTTLAEFDEWKAKQIEQAPTPGAKRLLNESLTHLRTQIGTKAAVFEDAARIEHRSNEYDKQIANWQTVVGTDPTQFGAAIAAIRETAPDIGGKKADAVRKGEQAIAEAFMQGWIAKDPAAAKLALERGTLPPEVAGLTGRSGARAAGAPTDAGGSSFDQAIKSLLKREGGYVASDGKSAAPANFGINQRANPDIDVKNLTEAQAVEIYRKRYWDKIGGDNLPPATALVAMDTAALQGVEVARRLLAETGGDPAAMIARRREQLGNLAKGDPEHAKQLAGWTKRLDGLEAEVNGMPAAQRASIFTPPPADEPKGDNAAINMIPFQRRLQLIRQADTEQSQRAVAGKASFDRTVRDASASYLQTGTYPNPPSEAEFIRYYGPDEGAAKYRELQDAQQVGQHVQGLKGMSNAEQLALLAREQPAPGPDFYRASQRHGMLVQAVQNDQQARAADPAAYVQRNAGTVQAAYQALVSAKSPEDRRAAADAYATASIAEQTRLGVTQPQIVSKGYIEQVLAKFDDQQNGGQNAAQLVRSLADTWGANWPAVYAQFGNKLPGSAIVIGAGMEPRPAEMLARVSVVPREDLVKGIARDDVKGVTDSLPGVMADFQRTLTAQGDVATFPIFYEQTEKLALAYVQAGKKPAQAVQQAFAEVAGSRYEFTQTYRVPRTEDVPAVIRGARAAISTIDPENLTIPRSMIGLNEAQTRTAYVSALKDQAYWVTASDESGLTLYANGAAVLDAKGKPITRQWLEFTAAGELPAKRGVVSEFGTAGGGYATLTRKR